MAQLLLMELGVTVPTKLSLTLTCIARRWRFAGWVDFSERRQGAHGLALFHLSHIHITWVPRAARTQHQRKFSDTPGRETTFEMIKISLYLAYICGFVAGRREFASEGMTKAKVAEWLSFACWNFHIPGTTRWTWSKLLVDMRTSKTAQLEWASGKSSTDWAFQYVVSNAWENCCRNQGIRGCGTLRTRLKNTIWQALSTWCL